MKTGYLDHAPGGILRMSTLLRRAEAAGATEAAAEVRRVHAQFPACPKHGPLKDPIIGHVGDQIAICCPWCSSPEILAAWEAEENLS